MGDEEEEGGGRSLDRYLYNKDALFAQVTGEFSPRFIAPLSAARFIRHFAGADTKPPVVGSLN